MDNSKKILLAFAAIVIFIGIIIFISEDGNSMAKEFVALKQKELPQRMNGGTITKVSYDEMTKTITFVYKLNDHYLNMIKKGRRGFVIGTTKSSRFRRLLRKNIILTSIFTDLDGNEDFRFVITKNDL